MCPRTAGSGPRNSLWTPNSLCFLIQLRLLFSSCSGMIRLMEATKMEQDGEAFSIWSSSWLGMWPGTLWHKSKIPKMKCMNNPKDKEMQAHQSTLSFTHTLIYFPHSFSAFNNLFHGHLLWTSYMLDFELWEYVWCMRLNATFMKVRAGFYIIYKLDSSCALSCKCQINIYLMK